MSGYSELAQALLDTGAAILTKIEYIEMHSNINQIDNVAHDLRLGSRLLAEHLFELAGTVNQDQLVRAVSIVGNMERIADSLDESSPALKDVKTPGEPAHMQVLEVNPIQQGKRWRNKVIRFFKVLTGRK